MKYSSLFTIISITTCCMLFSRTGLSQNTETHNDLSARDWIKIEKYWPKQSRPSELFLTNGTVLNGQIVHSDDSKVLFWEDPETFPNFSTDEKHFINWEQIDSVKSHYRIDSSKWIFWQKPLIGLAAGTIYVAAGRGWVSPVLILIPTTIGMGAALFSRNVRVKYSDAPIYYTRLNYPNLINIIDNEKAEYPLDLDKGLSKSDWVKHSKSISKIFREEVLQVLLFRSFISEYATSGLDLGIHMGSLYFGYNRLYQKKTITGPVQFSENHTNYFSVLRNYLYLGFIAFEPRRDVLTKIVPRVGLNWSHPELRRSYNGTDASVFWENQRSASVGIVAMRRFFKFIMVKAQLDYHHYPEEIKYNEVIGVNEQGVIFGNEITERPNLNLVFGIGIGI